MWSPDGEFYNHKLFCKKKLNIFLVEFLDKNDNHIKDPEFKSRQENTFFYENLPSTLFPMVNL